jgi:hypothetical protein
VKRLCRAGTFGSSFGISASSGSLGLNNGNGNGNDDDDDSLAFYCEGFCARGHWCGQGSTSSKQNKCPAGTYGAARGLKNKQCSGLCERGHYCPAGSVSSKELPCPAGRYGNRTGLQTAECSSECSVRTLPSLMREKDRDDLELGVKSSSGILDVVTEV